MPLNPQTHGLAARATQSAIVESVNSTSAASAAAALTLPDGFRPRTGTLDAWNAAYVRVEDYLRAHRIHSRLHQSRLIQAILERAAQRHAADPSSDPTTLAAGETEAWMDHWFAAALGENDSTDQRLAITGRVALLLTDGALKWPYSFLDTKTIPPEFSQAMQASSMQAGPDMTVSSMVPRPIDLGIITTAAGGTLERMERWPVLRTLVFWGLFLATLTTIFFLTR